MGSLIKNITNLFDNIESSTQLSQTNYWIYITVAIFVSIILSYLARKIIRLILCIFLGKLLKENKSMLISKLIGPLQLLFGVLFFFLFYMVIDTHKDVKSTLIFGLKTAAFLAVTYFFYRVLDLIFAKAILEHKEARTKIGLILPLGRRVAKTILLITAFLFFIAQFGVDVSALLVGLGVGSLAIALAAQKILENLFGGAVLSLDQPFKVGDYCKCGDVLGTIEEIGIRSTRIRTLDRTQVSIPNANLSQMTIENYNEREKIRLYHILRLSLDTPIQKIKIVLEKIISLINENEEFHHDVFRVRLLNGCDTGFDIEIYVFTKTVDWTEFVGVREGLLISIFKFLEGQTIRLAVPERKIRNTSPCQHQ